MYWGEKASSEMSNVYVHMWKTNISLYLSSDTKIETDWSLHIRPGTLAMIGGNASKTLQDLGLFKKDSRNSRNNLQNAQIGFHKTKLLLHPKENSQQNEESAYRQGEKSLPSTYLTGYSI